MRRFGTTALAVGLVTLLFGGVPPSVDGGIILFTKEISVNRSVNIFDSDQFNLKLGFGNSFFNPTNGVTLFGDLMISPSDIGQTFTADPNDPDFSEVAGRLTDGLNQYVKVMLTENQVNGLLEQRGWQEHFFFGHVAPQTPPDLVGARIDEIVLHIDKFNISSSSPPGGPTALSAQALTAGQQFDLVFTLQIISNVPEPSAGLLSLACLAFVPRRVRATDSRLHGLAPARPCREFSYSLPS